MSDDPFEQQERYPSISWKNAPKGTTIDGTVIEAPKEVQGRDFESGEPAYWDKEQTQPKMTVVVGLQLADGEKRSLWCPRPSAIFAAVAEAQKDAGERISEGGRLRVRLTGFKPNEKNPKLNDQKLFKAKYDPPDAFAQPEAEKAAKETSPEPETASEDFDDEPPF